MTELSSIRTHHSPNLSETLWNDFLSLRIELMTIWSYRVVQKVIQNGSKNALINLADSNLATHLIHQTSIPLFYIFYLRLPNLS